MTRLVPIVCEHGADLGVTEVPPGAVVTTPRCHDTKGRLRMHVATEPAPDPVPRLWVLPLPYETPPLSMNSRMTWQQEARVKKQIRDTVRVLVASAGVPRLARIVVELAYTPRTRGTRDPDNLVGTLKPAIDGLRDYAATAKRPAHVGIVADDAPAFVDWPRPVITDPGPAHSTGRLTLTIREDTTS